MKKIGFILAIFTLCFMFSSCSKTKAVKIIAEDITKEAVRNAGKEGAEEVAKNASKRIAKSYVGRSLGEQVVKKAARDKVYKLMEKEGANSFLKYSEKKAAKELTGKEISLAKKEMLASVGNKSYKNRLLELRRANEMSFGKGEKTIQGRTVKMGLMEGGKDLAKSQNTVEKYLSKEVRNTLAHTHLPKRGKWLGKPGESKWIPEDLGKIPPNKEYSNLDGLTWGEIMKKYKCLDGIPFKNGEIDFEAMGLVKAKVNMVDIGIYLKGNPKQYGGLHNAAFAKLAEQRHCTVAEMRKFKEKNRLLWHESCDGRTMLLVPQEIHGNINHFGGRAMYGEALKAAKKAESREIKKAA